MKAETPAEIRASRVVLLGRVGAGKTTLFDALAGDGGSRAPTPPSSRRLIYGAVRAAGVFFELADTPGFRRVACELDRQMNRRARRATEDCDGIVLMVRAGQEPAVEDQDAFRRALARGGPTVLFLNRFPSDPDRSTPYRDLWQQSAAARTISGAAYPEPTIVAADARLARAGDAWVQALAAALPLRPSREVASSVYELSPADWLADTVRGKAAARLPGPDADGVAVEWERLEIQDRSIRAAGVVHVDRSAAKGILIGYKGRTLRAVRRAAEAEAQVRRSLAVTLELRVEVSANWRNNIWMLQRFGCKSG